MVDGPGKHIVFSHVGATTCWVLTVQYYAEVDKFMSTLYLDVICKTDLMHIIYSLTLKTQHFNYRFFLSVYRVFTKIFVELKSTISVLNFNTKNETSVSVTNALCTVTVHDDIKRFPKLNKNKLHNMSMGTKQFLQVKHDFWKESPKPKRMLLVGLRLQ